MVHPFIPRLHRLQPSLLSGLMALLIMFASVGCKKDPPPSPKKSILSFSIKAANNSTVIQSDYSGLIANDSIFFKFPPGTPLNNFVPTITFEGQSLSPSPNTAQNFTSPVRYTVTAQDGSTRTYVVVARYFSSDKAILSFDFTAAYNPSSITTDAKGVIQGDTITVFVDPGVDIGALKPLISFTGVGLYPSSGETNNFYNNLKYEVIAEDGSRKSYIVRVDQGLTEYIGCDDGYLYALNASNGNIRWKVATGGGIRSSPDLVNNVVYIGSGDSYLYAIDAATGTVKWKYKGPGGIASSPFVTSGVVYVCSGNFLLAVNATTGNLIWQYNAGDFVYRASPVVVNGLVIYGHPGGYGVHAVNAADGTPQWSNNGGFTTGTPIVLNNVVYATGEGRQLYAIDAATGTTIYAQGEGFSYYGPAVSNGVAFVGAKVLYARNISDGSLKWTYNPPSVGDLTVFSSPVVDNGVVYTCNNQGYIYAIEEATGKLKWTLARFLVGSNSPSTNLHPAIAYRTLYVGSFDKEILALDAANGNVRWKTTTNGSVLGAPLIADAKGKLFYPGLSGHKQ